MFSSFLPVLLLFNGIQEPEHMQFSIGANYSSYHFYQDSLEAQGKWGLGGEIAVHNLVSSIDLKLRATKIRFEPATTPAYAYEYTPITLCTSFDILPFSHAKWLNLSIETGLGIYLWKGLYNEVLIVLPDGKEMDERDIGFVAGATLQIRPIRFVALEFASRYNYIASSDIYKYGYYDKDEKIWENGLGLKIIIP